MTVGLFVYEGSPIDPEASGRPALVRGTLFDVSGVGRALMLAGGDLVRGEVRSVTPERLRELDAHAAVAAGLYRRVGIEVGSTACWTYVAGPRLAPRLTADRRVRSNARMR